MSNMSEQDLLRKVSALLAKAEGTDNEHEASAFFEKAHEMMVTYAIDEARVRAEQRKIAGARIEEPIVEDFMFSSYAHHAQAKATLLAMIAKSQSVRTFPYDNRKDTNHDREGNRGLHESQWTKFVGYRSDIEHVKLLYLNLLIQSQRFATEDWRQRYGTDKYSSWDDGHVGKFTWLSGHMEGFADRIGERFRELTEVIYSSSLDGKELILDKDANILEWMYDHGLAVRPRPPKYYCWTVEPEENRPFNADGRTLSKKWEPAYCIIEVQPGPDGVGRTPHEGDHKFNYRPAKTKMSYYSAKGRVSSYEGRHAGRSAGDRADIGHTRLRGSQTLLK